MAKPATRFVIVGVLALLLSGCGDIYEKVYFGRWQGIGTPTAPVNPYPQANFPKIALKTIEEGEGNVIKPGDLVYATVSFTSETLGWRADQQPIINVHKKELAFWVGNGPVPVKGDVLRLATPELRALFVGVRVGSRVALHFPQPRIEMRLTTKGLLLVGTKDDRMRDQGDSDYVSFDNHEYEFTVIKSCPAKLLYRQAVLKQWGWYIFNVVLPQNIPFEREGQLVWAALEADCGPGHEKIRLEKGPSYLRTGSLGLDWPEGYEKAVRKGRVSNMD